MLAKIAETRESNQGFCGKAKKSITAWELRWKGSIKSIYLSSLQAIIGPMIQVVSKQVLRPLCCMCWELESQIVLIVPSIWSTFLSFSLFLKRSNFHCQKKREEKGLLDKKKYFQLNTQHSLICIFIVWILELKIL